MKNIELLAPAGSLEKAKIAFLYGADAVYAGTSKLSLRSRAEMNTDTLSETIEYAHSINKKVYVAMNIYAYDGDYDEIKKEIAHLRDINVDAIIASDGGIIECIKEIAPEVEIHLSTQANATSLESCKFWYKNGAKRIILARELSKDKIEYIMKNKPEDMEIEMFIHGAICFAYSGRCYLSQYLTDRGANCGDCSQPCRFQYKVTAEEVNTPGSIVNIDFDEKGTYIFSSKDLCLIKQIPTIIEMGLDSLKIEGRLKTDYYLAMVTRVYRKAIDDYLENPNEWDYTKYMKELEKVKTRGVSEFYFTDSNNQDIHDFDGFSENLDYEYGAKVIEKIDNNKYKVEIKNKLKLGDYLEVLVPKSTETLGFNIEKLYDVKTEQEIPHINPGIKGQAVIIEIPYELEKGWIIRRKK
ncbi:MAG: U32 family peptidase [Clostridia bacterium]|nr:U32 family peptidase [Clostridia bacterium]